MSGKLARTLRQQDKGADKAEKGEENETVESLEQVESGRSSRWGSALGSIRGSIRGHVTRTRNRASKIATNNANNQGFSKGCVIPCVLLSILISLGLGAAIFYVVYYLLIVKDYCPWTQMGTGCYQFFQEEKDWYKAQEACQARGGHLAQLEGFDKQTDVVRLFNEGSHSHSCFWIGGYQADEYGSQYYWNASSKPMSHHFTEWEEGYPKSRIGTPSCVDFCYPDFGWRNENCQLLKYSLCEYG